MAAAGFAALFATAAAAELNEGPATGSRPWVATEPWSKPFVGARSAGVGEARSVEIKRVEEPIFQAPSADSPRRGTAALGARLPLFSAQLGPGCAGRWFGVGPWAYVCEAGATPSLLPVLAPSGALLSPNGLPYRYAFVSKDGSFGYAALESAEDGVPDTQLQPGFGVALQRTGEKSNGDPFGLTTHGFWLPLRDLVDVPPSYFQGSAWASELGWVARDGVPVFSAPGRRRAGQLVARLTAVAVLETQKRGGEQYLRVSATDWLRAADVRRPALSEPPSEVRAHERWLDVDLARQVLVAYSGKQAVFATLISSGRGSKGSETATPVGSFRIWVKLRSSDMDNVEDAAARENYAIEAVPWVMFFHRGYGLHGTFWHQRFGEVRSHGCVNLAPRDAERLFHWTRPGVPPGWTAALPTTGELGTLVRVRAD